MNVTDAKQLLDTLKHELENADLKTVRLSKIFVLSKSLFGQPVLLKRRSLRGRLALSFSLHESERARELHIREHVALAFQSVASSESPQTLSDLRWWTKLHVEFNQGLAEDRESYRLPVTEELDVFEQFHSAFTAEKIEYRLNQIRRLSLLNSSKKPFYSISDLQSFIRMTQLYGDMNAEAFQAYQEYLKRSNHEMPVFSSRLALIQEAKKQNRDLHTAIGECANVEERRRYHQIKASELEKNIQDLKIGQSCFFQGSVGRKKIDLQQLLLLIHKLPENIKSQLQEISPYLFGAPSLPNPETFIHENLQAALKEIEKNLGADQLDFLTAFVPNEQKSGSLLAILQNNLPDQMKALLEKGLNTSLLDGLSFLSQKIPPQEMTEFFEMILQLGDLTNYPSRLGVILQIIRVVPAESSVNVLKLISQNLSLLSTSKGRIELCSQIEAQIKSYLPLKNEGMKEAADTTLSNLVNLARSTISPEVMRLVDPEGYFSYSDFWIEFKREDAKNFTVLIYPSKALLHKHPVNYQKVQWPIKLAPIPPKKLNREFFHRLLFEIIEPLYNPEYHVQGNDVYQEILDYFDNKIVLEDSYWRDQEESFDTETDITKLLITPTHISSQITTIHTHFELIISLCSPYKNPDGLLLIPSKDVCEALENTLHPLMALVEKCKTQLTSDLYRRFKATEEEILHAVQAYKLTTVPLAEETILPNELHISEPVFKHIRTVFHHAGIDDALIISNKQMLCWAFGDEIGDFIEVLAASVGPLRKENAQPAVAKRDNAEKGWLKNFVSSVFFHLAFTAFRTVLSAVQIYKKGMSAIGGFYLAQTAASYFLPDAAKQWLQQVWAQLLRQCIQMSAYLFMRALMNPDQIEQMQTYTRMGKQHLHRLANQALGKETLSFELIPSEKIENNEEKIEEFIPENGVEASLQLDCQTGVPTPETLLGYLQEWEINLKKYKNITRPDVLDLLPVPCYGDDPFWDRVSNPRQCLQILKRALEEVKRHSLDPIYNLFFYVILNKLAKESMYDANQICEAISKVNACLYLVNNPKDFQRIYAIWLYLDCRPAEPPFQSKYLLHLSANKSESQTQLKWSIYSHRIERIPHELTLFPERPDPQEVSLFLSVLKERMEHIEKEPFFSLMFQRFIQSLPTPKRESDPFWDSVSYPGICFELLGELAIKFLNMQPVLNREIEGTKVIMAYAILAMLDKLRFALPELHLEGYEIDYYDLLVWLQDRRTVITSPSDLRRLEEVLSYYGHSFDRLPGPKELIKRKNAALFSGSVGEQLNSFCAIEAKYLQERLQDPEIQLKFSRKIFSMESFKKLNEGPIEKVETFMVWFSRLLKSHDLNALSLLEQYQRILKLIEEPKWQEKYPELDNVFQQLLVHENSPESEKIEVLYSDSCMIKKNPSPILPRSYSILREYKIHCKKTFRIPGAYQDRVNQISLNKKYFLFGPENQWLPKIGEQESGFFKSTNAIDNIGEVINAFGRFVDRTKTHYTPPKITIPQTLTESEVMDQRNQKNMDYSYELHLARAERSESLFHTIAYFHQNPEQLAKEGRFLYQAIFESVCLADLLSKQPHLAENIQSFFSDTIEYFLPSNIGMALWIAHVWRKTILVMQTKVHEDLFSPFEIMLKKLEEPLSESVYGKVAYHELNSLFLLDSGKMNAQLAASFFFSDFFPSYYQSVFESQSNLSSHFEMLNLDRFSRYWESLPEIKAYLADPDNLQEAMKAVIGLLGIDLPELESESRWTAITGRDFEFASGPYEISLWTGSVRSRTGEELTEQLMNGHATRANKKVEADRNQNPEPEKSLERISKDRLGYGMNCLSRFCPMDHMEVYALKNTSQIEHLVFTPFKLFFDMKRHPEGVRTYSKNFPGFFIAPKQFTPFLNRLGNYLLLQNEAGVRKVILPHHQWLPGLAMRFLKNIGPWATLAVSMMHQVKGEQEPYSVFELASDDQLISENPEDLVFLISLYYLQDNKEGIHETSKLFEKVCKLKQVNKLTYEMLFPLFFLPIGFKDISHTRQHLLSVIEESENISVKERVKLDRSQHLALAAMILVDLSQQKSPHINEFQEWFLFRAYFYHAKAVLQDQEEHSSGIFWILNVGLQVSLESLSLPRHLVDRLEFLETKFGIEISKKSKALRFATQIAHTSVKLPSLNDDVDVSPAPTSFSYKELGISLISRGIINHFNVESLNLRSLVPELGVHKKDVCFIPSLMTAKEFKESWLTYFEIAAAFDISDFETAERIESRKRELSQMLSLMGGWDRQTRLLIGYLRTAMQFPAIFSAKTLNQLVQNYLNPDPTLGDPIEVEKKCFEKIGDFFSSLNMKTIGVTLGKSVVNWGKSKIIERSNFPGTGASLSIVPFSYAMTSSVRWALSAGKVALDRWNQMPIQTAPKPISSDLTYYSQLNEEDQFFNCELKAIYDLAFISFSENLFEESVFKQIEVKGADHLNVSLTDYYHLNSHLEKIFLRNESSLWSAYYLLSKKLKHYQAQLEQQKQRFCALFAKQFKNPQELFWQLQACFLQGDFTVLMKDLTFEPEVLESLELALSRYFVRLTRIQQMQRAAVCLEEMARCEVSPVLQAEKIQRFAEILKAERGYQFHNKGLRLLRRLLVFEVSTSQMLWNKQADVLEKICKEKNTTYELLCALGKNWAIQPILDAFLANGEQAIVNIFPASVFDPCYRTLAAQGKIFHQEANVWRFSRSSKFTIENLEALLTVLTRTIERYETINMTKEDIQSLELNFVIRMDNYIRNKRSDSNEEMILCKLAQLLETFQKKCLFVGDEAHELFNYRQELNYPIGASTVLSARDYFMIEGCMDASAEILQQIKTRDQKFSEAEYTLHIAMPIAKLMIKYPSFRGFSETQYAELERFFWSRENSAASWIEKHELFREFSMVRGVITELLYLTVNVILNVDYGTSLNNQGEYARPYAGNTSPLENFTISQPHEAMVKTFSQFLQTGLNNHQFYAIIQRLFFQIHEEAEERQLIPSKTNRYRDIIAVFGNLYNPLDPFTVTDAQKDELKNHPKMIILYVRHFVRAQVRYWKESACSNVQDFGLMSHSGFYGTATPGNFGTYPPQLKMLWDPGTLGEAVHVIKQKYRGYHVFSANRPEEVLVEALQTYFSQPNEFAVLADCGPSPLLKGLKAIEVAKTMIKFIKEHRPDILGVVFLDSTHRVVFLAKDAIDPVPLENVQVLPEQRLTYIDDHHGFSANIAQKTDAASLVLAGERTTLTRLVQLCFRLRRLKNDHKLESSLFKTDASAVQTVCFGVLKGFKDKFSPDQDLNISDFIEIGASNESRTSSEENYASYPQKLIALDRRACFNKIVAARNSFKSMSKLFTVFRNYLIQKVEVDPRILYAPMKRKEKAGDVCARMRESSFKAIQNNPYFTEGEKESHRKARDKIPMQAMPEYVDAYFSQNELKYGLMQNLNQMMQIENDTYNDNDNELDVDVNAQKHIYLQPSYVDDKLFHDWTWKENFDPHLADWLSFSSPLGGDSWKNSLPQMFLGQENPPLFAVTDLLEHSQRKEFVNIKDCFDARLWFSNNYLPTYINYFKETQAKIGTTQQRKTWNVLVHVDATDSDLQVISMGCISIGDTASLRKQLDQYPAKTSRKTFIYDVREETFKAGTINLQLLKKNPDFIACLAQLKFLGGVQFYNSEEMAYLEKWLRQNGRKELQHAFEAIQKDQKQSVIKGSDIASLFNGKLTPFQKL